MADVLAFNVDSVVSGGLYITVTSFDTAYSQSDSIDVAIVDGGPNPPGGTGQYTGTMTKAGLFGPSAPTGSLFYSWFDLVGYTPTIVGNNETTILMQDTTAGGALTSPTIYSTGDGTYFPWPAGGIACFTTSSQLLTPAGYVKASTLRAGDLLVTSDGRQVPIKVYTSVLKADKASAPYLIPKNSLAHNVPVADLRLSPWHAISLGEGLWMKPQSAAELNPGSVTQYDIGKDVHYYHFEAPNYFTDNFICDGTVVESFSAKQATGKGRSYTWSPKHLAYKRNNLNNNSKKSVAL